MTQWISLALAATILSGCASAAEPTAQPWSPAAAANNGAAIPANGTFAVTGAGANPESTPADLSAAGAPAPVAPAPAPMPARPMVTCPAGELCQASMVGGYKFCAPMMQPLPPTCMGANAPCGTDMKGTCFDGGPSGFPGVFSCLYLQCM